MMFNFSNVITTKDYTQANCITHGGTFHADEVFATAILSLLFDEIRVCRTCEYTDEMKEVDAIIYDVGLGELDHHQQGGNGERANGVMYAGCGLVWRKYGKQVLKKLGVRDEENEYIHKLFDTDLIQFIDANDNGITPPITSNYNFVTLASVISSFNPQWNEKVDSDVKFLQAVEFARSIVENFLIKAMAKSKAKDIVDEAINKSSNHILVLEEYMPWKEIILTSEEPKAKEILFAVFPSNRGGYNVYAVPKAFGCFDNRKDLPEEWAGLRDEELQKVTGVKTARFCHIACFICTAETKEDALKLAELAIAR